MNIRSRVRYNNRSKTRMLTSNFPEAKPNVNIDIYLDKIGKIIDH